MNVMTADLVPSWVVWNTPETEATPKDVRSDVGATFEQVFASIESFVFMSLVGKWREERGSTSSTAKMAMCPAYQKIIGMGEAAIPFIIAQLREEKDEPDYWFWALRVITREDPVPPEDRGNHPQMAKAWIEWAEDQGRGW